MLKRCAELFVENLKSKNLNFESGTNKSGDSVVEFPYQGKTARIFFGGDEGEYMSLYIVFENLPAEKRTDVILVCNDLNNQYKWVTAYVDKDNDVILHVDAILCAANAADEAFELLVRSLKLMDECKPQIMRAIYA